MASPIRRGIPVTFDLDPDARELLRHLSPSSTNYGHLLASLIRAEFDRRVLRKKALARLQAEATQEAPPQEICS
jgi:hypothetical protein